MGYDQKTANHEWLHAVAAGLFIVKELGPERLEHATLHFTINPAEVAFGIDDASKAVVDQTHAYAALGPIAVTEAGLRKAITSRSFKSSPELSVPDIAAIERVQMDSALADKIILATHFYHADSTKSVTNFQHLTQNKHAQDNGVCLDKVICTKRAKWALDQAEQKLWHAHNNKIWTTPIPSWVSLEEEAA